MKSILTISSILGLVTGFASTALAAGADNCDLLVSSDLALYQAQFANPNFTKEDKKAGNYQTRDRYEGDVAKTDNDQNGYICVVFYLNEGQNKAGFWIKFMDDSGGK